MKKSNEWMMNYLKQNDIKPSTIRIKVLEFLLNNQIHPTVDEIYKSLIEDIPTLSKTSIYNTLNLFSEKGIVRVLALCERELRYDIDTSGHGHFKCEKCGKIYDFTLKNQLNTKSELQGFKINFANVNLFGICKQCNKQ